MVVPMEQWAGQPFQDKSADLWVVMLSDHNEKYSDRMERSHKEFAVTFELRFPFPLTLMGTSCLCTHSGFDKISTFSLKITCLTCYHPGGCGFEFRCVNLKHNMGVDILSILEMITLEWMPENPDDGKSTLVLVRACCSQAMLTQIYVTIGHY